jgi:hypothetical protein
VHRTNRGRFAIDEEGALRPGKSAVVIVGREPDSGAIQYLAGLLNSELLDLWYSIRGRTPRDIWRDYEPKPMARIPFRPAKGDPRAGHIANLVPEIACNRRALLPHRSVVRDLGRTIKDPWRIGPVEIDEAALVRELPVHATVAVRIDPRLSLVVGERSGGRVARTTPEVLVISRARKEVGRVTGPAALLDLLERVVGERADENFGETLLPKDEAAFAALADARRAEVERLLREGRAKVEQVERLVCALYGVTDDLTEEVVAHAVARAERGMPSE